MTKSPEIPQKAPFKVELEAGKTYAWCACGRSNNQPFCDGSHEETGFSPMIHKPTESGTAVFCGCKHTGNAPFCDGTHSRV